MAQGKGCSPAAGTAPGHKGQGRRLQPVAPVLPQKNRQINRFMWVFCLFSCKVQELEDKV